MNESNTGNAKEPGVIDHIERLLLTAPGDGYTLYEMVDEIERITGRDPAHLTSTVRTQLSRLRKTRNLDIISVKVEKVTRYRAVKLG